MELRNGVHKYYGGLSSGVFNVRYQGGSQLKNADMQPNCEFRRIYNALYRRALFKAKMDVPTKRFISAEKNNNNGL